MKKNWQSKRVRAEGFVEPGLESVAAEFERNFLERTEVGAAFAATRNGKPIIDIWGGRAAPGRTWQENTLQVIFSGTKGFVAGCILKLIEAGKLELNAPVERYWPEFAQRNKDRVRVRHIVSHGAGLPGIWMKLNAADLTDYERLETLLATQPLAQDPNAFHAYHPLTIGWLLGAILRRVDGRTVGRFFSDEFARPLGLEAWIGLPESEEQRVGNIELGPGMRPWDADQSLDQQSDKVLCSIWGNPPLFPAGKMAWNTREYHAAEICGAGGIATARAMARFYGCMSMGGAIDGVRVLKPETVALGRRELSRFLDPYIGEPMAFGVVWAIQTEKGRFGPPMDAFGHSGAGGSIHGAWPAHQIGFSYTMNQMRVDPEDSRTRPVLKRLMEAITR